MKYIVFLSLFFLTGTFTFGQQTDPDHAEFTIKYVPDSIAYLINKNDTLFLVSGQILHGPDVNKWRLLTFSPERWREIVAVLSNPDLPQGAYLQVVAANLGPYTKVERKVLRELNEKDKLFTQAFNQNRKWKVTGISPGIYVSDPGMPASEPKREEKTKILNNKPPIKVRKN